MELMILHYMFELQMWCWRYARTYQHGQEGTCLKVESSVVTLGLGQRYVGWSSLNVETRETTKCGHRASRGFSLLHLKPKMDENFSLKQELLGAKKVQAFVMKQVPSFR